MTVSEVSRFHPGWRRPIALFFVLAFLIGSTAVAKQTLDQSVDAYVRDEMTKRQIPGLALAVVRHGRIQKIASYGYADVDFSVPVKSTTLFSIASVTKTVTAVGIIKLQEEGKLSVDDSIGLYLKEVPLSWREVKIRQVMSHTSGIPDVMSNPFTLDTVAETPEGMFHVFAEKPLDFVPGSKWQYNQANFMLLGMIIEKVSGQPYTEFCRDRLFGPIGVTPTFGYPQTLVANRSHTYTILHWSPTGVSRLEHVQLQTGRLLPSMLWPAGGLNLTAAEFSKWLIALESGKVVRKASLEQLWAPIKLNDGSTFEQAPPEPWRTFGLGWGSASDLGHRRVGFSGGTFATLFMYPKEELDVVVLTNMEGADPESLAEAIAHRYIAAGQKWSESMTRIGTSVYERTTATSAVLSLARRPYWQPGDRTVGNCFLNGPLSAQRLILGSEIPHRVSHRLQSLEVVTESVTKPQSGCDQTGGLRGERRKIALKINGRGDRI